MLRSTLHQQICLSALLPGTPFIKHLAQDSSPKIVRARLGNSLVLTCHMIGMPTPVAYWTKNGRAVSSMLMTPSNNVVELMNNEGRPTLETTVTIARLSFGCLSEADVGVYQCIGDNGVSKMITETKIVPEDVDGNCNIFC